MITIKTQVSAKDKLLQEYFAKTFCRALQRANFWYDFYSDDTIGQYAAIRATEDSPITKEFNSFADKIKNGEFPRFFVLGTNIFEIDTANGTIKANSAYSSQKEAIEKLEGFHVDYFVITDEIAEKYCS